MDGKVPISLTDNNPFVWNANDVVLLREKYRIVGALIGCLPRCPYQNSQLGLPLKLLKEEAAFLIQKGIGRLVLDNKSVQKPSQEELEEFHAQRNMTYQQQVAICREHREKEIKQLRHQILEGKRAKRKKLLEAKRGKNESGEKSCFSSETRTVGEEEDLESGDSEEDPSVEDEVDRIEIPTLPESASFVQIVTANPADRVPAPGSSVEWCYPSTVEEQLRCRVFADLWEKGYHVTSGAKFGGDFLVYPGDPLSYHSFYIAVCLPYHRKLSGLELISYGRLGSTVKKNVMLCCVDDTDSLIYHTLQWTHIS